MEFFGVAALIAMVYAVVNFLKYVTSGHYREALTQVVVWFAGLFCVWLFSAASATAALSIGDTGFTLGSLDWAGRVIAGFGFGSIATGFNDYKKARDDSDSAAVPPLGGEH